MIERVPYGASCWALLVATVISPFMIKRSIESKRAKNTKFVERGEIVAIAMDAERTL